MPNLPTPIRVAVGLAATAMDEARKLPETLPQAMTTVPMIAVSTAMQASLRMQQYIATLAARGDEVLSRLHRTSPEPPAWATFDDPPSEAPNESAAASRAAFDKIDYEHTGFHEGDDVPSRWDAVGVCDDGDTGAPPPLAKDGPPKKRAPRKTPPKTTLAEDLAAEAAQPNE
jgi:hypothetical protein